jgi:hypothetical protein
METLELLGVALGLATLAGINLYLTVFVAGLAIRMEWITLAPQYQQLEVLGDPVIVTVAGVLFFLEFFADKVPWVDSLWDSIHTVIRPIGAAMLAITVLGEANPVFDVVVGLLAGGMALTSHAAKAGTRLIVNASPEPFSNIGASVAEDAVVLAGLGLIATQPLIALGLAVAAVGLIAWLLPRAVRSARATLWFLWRRIASLTGRETGAGNVTEIPRTLAAAIAEARGPEARVEEATPCVGGRGFGRRNQFGWLLVTGGTGGGADFAILTGGRPELLPIPTRERNAVHLAGWICDRLEFRRPNGKRGEVIQLDRSRRAVAIRIAQRFRGHAQSSADTGPADTAACVAP